MENTKDSFYDRIFPLLSVMLVVSTLGLILILPAMGINIPVDSKKKREALSKLDELNKKYGRGYGQLKNNYIKNRKLFLIEKFCQERNMKIPDYLGV